MLCGNSRAMAMAIAILRCLNQSSLKHFKKGLHQRCGPTIFGVLLCKPKCFLQGNNIDHLDVTQMGFPACVDFRQLATPDQFDTESVLTDSPMCVLSLHSFVILEQDILLPSRCFASLTRSQIRIGSLLTQKHSKRRNP